MPSIKQYNCNQKDMDGNKIFRFQVLDNQDNPLPDVEFLEKPENGGNPTRIGLTDQEGKVIISDNPNTTVIVSHVSGESVQSELSELDDVIRFTPNSVDEVVITNESRMLGLFTVGGLILAGVAKSVMENEPLKIEV